MKQLSINEIKQVSLDILSHFHEFCVKNNLHYSMWAGSLIGTIRHHGYIPWDDDIDLCMPRPDYDLFFKLYKDSDEYAVFNYDKNGALLSWGRICDMKRTCSFTNYKWTNKNTGVYISIFPIDGAEPDLESLQRRFDICCEWCKENYSLRNLFRALSRYGSVNENIFIILRKIKYLSRLYSLKNKMLDNVRKHNEECRKYDFNTSDYVIDLAFASRKYRPKALWPKEDFDEFILAEFEERSVMIIKGYDRSLRLRYGDYMQLPPVEQQVAMHGSTNFYWK